MNNAIQMAKKFKKGIKNPNLVGRKLNQIYYRTRNRHSDGFNHSGVNIFEQDWDNLLILDACRFDTFADAHDLSGELTKVESKGARTPEFLRANFEGVNLHDSVYINANPMLHRRLDDFEVNVHDLFDLWKTDWDEETGTVLPGVVAKKTRTVASQYPNKRLIVHFIQPHYPFIGSDEVFHRDPGEGVVDDNLWRRLERGELDVPPGKIRSLYRDNLRLALPAVERLLLNLRGKNVVTSDHGNMFGERSWPIPHREWGHPPGIFTKELVDVPWLVYENGERKSITEGDADEEITLEDDAVVSERLESLGYVE